MRIFVLNIVGFWGGASNDIALFSPSAQINLFAAFRTKRAIRIFGIPNNFFTALRTIDDHTF